MNRSQAAAPEGKTLPGGETLANMADEPLVERARQGDEGAVRVLVQRHNQRLFRVARAVIRDDAEAEDVVQETYVQAFTHLHAFRGDAQLSTWLTRIAFNAALARVRRRRPTAPLEAVDIQDSSTGGRLIMFPSPQPPPNPERELARVQVRGIIERAIDTLPDSFRVVFVMRDVDGMSTEETASYLAIRIETVKTRLHRARKLMRSAIENELSGAFAEAFPFNGARCVHMAESVVEKLRAARILTV